MNTDNIRGLIKKTDHWGWVEGLYLGGNDCGVALRLLDGQGYEPESRSLWRKLCHGAGLVIDIGAHTGIYSLDALKAGAENVLSIEPYHMNFARLTLNIRHAGFSPENCMLAAASDENKEITLSVGTPPFYCSSGGRINSTYKNGMLFKVRGIRLDSLVIEELHSAVKVIKIDVEKCAVQVLNGMPKILSYKPDLILECTEDGLTEILKPLGYKFFRIDEKKGLSPVESLTPDFPFTFDCPNRYATCS